MAKITRKEYEYAHQKVWSEWIFNGKKYTSNEKHYTEICILYNKQNRFNPFTFLDDQYKDDIKYGKIIKTLKKIISILLVTIVVFVMFIFFVDIFLSFFQTLFLFNIAIVTMIHCVVIYLDDKYDILLERTLRKEKYYRDRLESDLNFRRQEKLKRILKKEK